MEFLKQAQWAIVVPTSMGVRLTPMNRQPTYLNNQFTMHATSAESNVLGVSASLGLQTKVLTTFVKGSPIAQFIKAELGKRHIAYEGKEVDAGGPWGYRHQFNIADAGYGPRGPRVANDRAGEVGLTLSVKDFDLTKLFQVEGVKILHLSGLIAALSPETGEFCVHLAEAAHEAGTRVSFDINYRASFWKGREAELAALFARIAHTADILIGNEEDFQLALGVQGPEHGGKDLSSQIDGFKGMIHAVQKAFPKAQTFATTLRQVVNANEHLWGAILYKDSEFHVIEPRSIVVYDRIGGGDGFVSGLLYSLVTEKPSEQCLGFAWASGALVATLETDYAVLADEAQLASVWSGNARVLR